MGRGSETPCPANSNSSTCSVRRRPRAHDLRPASPRRRRGGLLQGPHRLDHHRLQRRRRLRSPMAGCCRVISATISRGEPTIVPQNMPGAGSIKAANYLYGVAAKDGTVIGTFGRTHCRWRRCSRPRALTLTARSSPGSEASPRTRASASPGASPPIKTWDDFLAKPSTFGGEGAGADPDVFTRLYKNVFGAKVRLVTRLSGHQRRHACHGAAARSTASADCPGAP